MITIDAIHPNLKQLSNSSNDTLHGCARRYELDKLSTRKDNATGDEHLDFGKIVGLGVQELLTHGDTKRAVFAMFLKWKNMLDDDAGEGAKKTFWHALHAVDKFVGLQKGELSHYQLANLNGRPATEVGFSVDCGSGFYYRGFIDAILINTFRKKLVIYEGKTTKNRTVHEATFKNSAQGMAYSIVLDRIVEILGYALGSAYEVDYCVYKTSVMEWEIFHFLKSHTHRALWIKNILIDKKHVIEYATEEYFPMNGAYCYNFFKPCPHFDYCTISNAVLFKGAKIVERVEKKEKYDFHFNLAELVASQLERTKTS